MAPFSGMAAIQDVYLFPFFFGATMFAFDAPGLVGLRAYKKRLCETQMSLKSTSSLHFQIVSVEANMKSPLHFRRVCGVFVQAMLVVVLLQICFAFFGYWSYGENIASTILQNLPYNAV